MSVQSAGSPTAGADPSTCIKLLGTASEMGRFCFAVSSLTGR